MRVRIHITLLLAALAALTSPQLLAQSMRADGANDWLMLVATNSTDPGKEAEFNAWYDDIDIPDVLEVPGYMRARRGRKESPAPNANAGAAGIVAGRYVALYDISSPNIDRTIIDMLMATRKMESRKRSTPLLEVVERLYYRRVAPPVESADAKAATGRNTYLYVERGDANDARKLAVPPGAARGTRYELYRVLMVEPLTVPRFLTVYEIAADSPLQAMKRIPPDLRGEQGSLYLQIKDVSRPGGTQPR